MKLKHFYLPALAAVVGIYAYSCLNNAGYYSRFPGDKGAAYEIWETQNESFKVRITAYQETGIFMPGAFFAFESAPVGSNRWQTFLDYRADDPVSIPREQFQFANDRTAYFYNYENFLVTVNAGQNWSMWKPGMMQADGRSLYWGIKEAGIEADGKGKMTLTGYDEQSKQVITAELFTENFGQNWRQPPLRR